MLKRLISVLALAIGLSFSAVSFAAVDVNKATAAELDSIKGIGPGISAKILEERKKGNFKDWADLVERVKGVGDANAAKFSAAGMTVSGTSFKGAAAKPAAKADDKPAAKKDEKGAAKPDDKKDAKPAAAAAPAAAASKPDMKKEAAKDSKAASKPQADAAKKDDKPAAKKDEKAPAAKDAASAKK